MLLCILSGVLVILCSMAAGKINEWLDPRLRVTCGERKVQETEQETGKLQSRTMQKKRRSQRLQRD